MASLAHTATWTLDRPAPDRLVITLRGEFDADDARLLEAAIREHLSGAAPGALVALIHLSDLTRCTLAGREGLLAVQKLLGGVARRTAYLAQRPIFRGLGLWICHQAPDSNARTFPSPDLAASWLGSAEPRERALADRAVAWIGRLSAAKEARA